MDNSIGIDSLVLRHQPCGESNPYIPLPYERSPRFPVSGENVVLNIETDHNQFVQSVWCLWSVEGKELVNRIEAVITAKDEDVDHWQVLLPAFTGLETVCYRLFAENEKQKVESEEFSFSVSSWIKVTSINSIEDLDSKVDVRLSTELSGIYTQLIIQKDSGKSISLKLETNEEKTLQTNTLPSFSKIWDDLEITLKNDPFIFKIFRKSDGLYLETQKPLEVLVNVDGEILQYRFSFKSPVDEAFYGFGERFNALNQRGNRLDNYVFGQYTGQGKRTYIPIPFFISSHGYGLWIKTLRQAAFDMAASRPDCWAVTGCAEEDSSLELKLFFQDPPFEIVKAFTNLVGKPKLPPTWTFGPWMSSNDWNSQSEVIKQLHETQKQKIPASVLVIEAWSDEMTFYIWNDAVYKKKPSSEAMTLLDYTFPTEGRWPDPKSMINELHQNGIRVILWQNPVIKSVGKHEQLDGTLTQADEAYAIEQGYVVLKDDGSPHRVEAHMPWFCNSVVLDFSNKEAADWWLKKREYLITELGVDGFKTDGGEHIWDNETRFSNGMRGYTGINYYPLAYEDAYDHYMEKLRKRDYLLFSRAGYTGAQQYPCHWAGDEKSTWDAFRATLRALLNIGLSGLPFVGWDIAGFAGPLPSSDLYLRATAFSVFCPIMQYHSDVNNQRLPSRDRTPWNIQQQTGNENVISIFRDYANLRMNLLPYLLSQAEISSKSGIPLMRALSLVYPRDFTSRDYPFEYFFGDSLLVSPVVKEAITDWPIYLPEGEWRDLWTGDVTNGPVELNVKVSHDRIPVFQKKGSILPLNLGDSLELASPVGNSTEEIRNLVLSIFPGKASQLEINQGKNKEPLFVKSESDNNNIGTIITLQGLTVIVDLLVHARQPKEVNINGIPIPKNETPDINENYWTWNQKHNGAHIHIGRNQGTVIVTLY